ncbi:MAG TPA: hypothetical protein VN522_08630 [Solirubrobacterales bacterium]|nr:hypothetical protein [Solirubrobacterales bacterium]
MSNLPAEHDDESAFGDFLSRLRPYPVPPGFRVALLYAAGGSILLLLAGLAASALPTGRELSGHVAIGAEQVGLLLEVFSAPAAVFAFFGLAGLTVTAVIGLRRRVDEGAGGVLTALTVFGIVAGIWAALGWVIVAIAFLTTIVLYGFVVALILGAGFAAMRAEWGMAIGMVVVAVLLSSWLQNATGNDPPQTADPSPSSPPATEQSVIAPPVVEPTEQHKPPPPGLVRQRIALEARMTSEYEAWHEVPYVSPCDHTVRTAELASLRDVMAQMRQRLWEAARNREPGAFRQVAADLERADRERTRTIIDPHGAYEQFSRCPSAVGVMAFRW